MLFDLRALLTRWRPHPRLGSQKVSLSSTSIVISYISSNPSSFLCVEEHGFVILVARKVYAEVEMGGEPSYKEYV